MTTRIYEIKNNKSWTLVRATSMIALSEYCKANNIKDWRAAGMLSNAELKQSQNLKVVA